MIDIDTVMGDNTQLGHASSLQSGQRVPDGKRYHGSPAVETTSDYCPIESMEMAARCAPPSIRRSNSRRCSSLQCRCRSSPTICGTAFAAAGTSAAVGISMLSLLGVSVAWLLRRDSLSGSRRSMLIPRLCMMFLQAGVTYPAFGFHHLLQSVILRVSNSQFFCVLFGD